MRMIRTRALVLLGALCLACAGEDDPVSPSSFARNAPRAISGRVLGPDGSNICNTVGSGTLLLRLLNPDFVVGSGNSFLGQQNLTCPNNRYSLPAAPGTAHLRVEVPTENIDGLPLRSLDEFPGDTRAEQDVHIVEGTALAGSATFEGSPSAEASITLRYDFNSNFTAAFGVPDQDGAWMDSFGRSPFLLQAGVRYRATCDPVPGTRVTDGPPSGGFLFPTGLSAINCTMEAAPSVAFSHTATRLVVTPMPGDIGGYASREWFDRYGVGWGVQFPVQPGSTPSRDQSASHLFTGGLLVGRSPDTVLAGVDVGGQMQCLLTCRDLGLDATLQFTSMGSGGRQVTWRYSDARSFEPAGLEITQTSMDGRRPNDYVLFRFTIRNTGRFTRTFHAGFFGDWDVDVDALNDVGSTDLNGKLMSVTSQGESGIHVGTLLLGVPVSGNFFFTAPEFLSQFEQVDALSGALQRETAGPADLRYIQGGGPITLRRGQQRDLWLAVVAGDNKNQLLANAAAAEADVAGRATR